MKNLLIAILTLESRLIIGKYKPFIIAVTGSVGKTSTKDAIYDVLKAKGSIRKSEKSMNSEIGLPLTIIGAPNAWRSPIGWIKNIFSGARLVFRRSDYPDTLILEIGADHPGDIKKVTQWLKPDIAVITKISKTPVHVEFFDSPDQVFEEKAFLATAVKDGGTLVLFGDDDKIMSLSKRVSDREVNVVSYGLSDGTDVRGVRLETMYDSNGPSGISIDISAGGGAATVSRKGIVGDVYAYPVLAACAVAKARNVSLAEAAESLQSFSAPRGRMNIIQGINGSVIIDDSYNSSPDAALAALNALKKLRCSGRRIAVLGDMMELGKHSSAEHRRVGSEAASSTDILITVGQRSKATADEAVRSGMTPDRVMSFDSSSEAAERLKPFVAQGDIVLVKGSQSVRAERISAALLRQPENAKELLVRQEREWLEKA